MNIVLKCNELLSTSDNILHSLKWQPKLFNDNNKFISIWKIDFSLLLSLLLSSSWWRNICQLKINWRPRQSVTERCDKKRQDIRGNRLIGVTDYSRRQAQHCGMPDWWTSSDGYWGRDDSTCHGSVAVLLERRAEAGQTGSLACLLWEHWTAVVQRCTQFAHYYPQLKIFGPPMASQFLKANNLFKHSVDKPVPFKVLANK